jgi:DNA-directed RNA polymerase subunit RPC12/RpoP
MVTGLCAKCWQLQQQLQHLMQGTICREGVVRVSVLCAKCWQLLQLMSMHVRCQSLSASNVL